MSDKTYQELAEQALWKAEKSIGASIERRSLFLQEAQVYATLHLAEVTSEAQRGTFDDSEQPVTEIRASATSDAMPTNECDHYGVDSGGTDYYGTSNPPQESDWNFTYCPKCGEKL